MFLSTYLHNIDKKCRLFIPAKLRADLGERFYVSIPIDGQPCIAVYTIEEWEKLQSQIDTLPMLQRKEVRRTISPFTSEVECDAQGRILLPQILMNFAGLTDSAYVVGTTDTIEIWNKEKWDEHQSKMTSANISALMQNMPF